MTCGFISKKHIDMFAIVCVFRPGEDAGRVKASEIKHRRCRNERNSEAMATRVVSQGELCRSNIICHFLWKELRCDSNRLLSLAISNRPTSNLCSQAVSAASH